MNKPIYVLGTGLSHDGSSCLLKDGEIIVAIEKERLSRIKHDGGMMHLPQPIVLTMQALA
jgi:carbamoyltransferase